MFSGTQMRRLVIFLLAITVCVVFGSAGSAQAGSGVFPDSPRQIAPLDYGYDKASIEFSFSSYDYNDGVFVGYPVAYYIEIYHGSTLIVSEYVWSSTFTYSQFIGGETYSWKVQAIYEFYDELREYCGLYESDMSALATFRNITAAKPAVPVLFSPTFDQRNREAFVGGKAITLWWWPSMNSVPDLSYEVDVARDNNFNTIIETLYPTVFAAYIEKLPADGSRIFWRVKAQNEFGWSDDYSQTASFVNDCYMASIGSGGPLNHIDTCSDDYTNITGYLLKDISRRGTGKMKPEAAIITGLNSDNVTSAGVERQIGKQITPLQDPDNIWNATSTNINDAIHAQAYTGKFYDYLLSTFRKRAADAQNNLNSYDGNGSSMYNLVAGGNKCAGVTAYWDTNSWNVHYCQNGASRFPDLVGHEWGHAVAGTASTRGNASLGDDGEAGAMDEAFSDWLGMAFKHAYYNTSWVYASSRDFASLSPNYYYGNGYDPNADIHTNRNVPDTMFYLLAAEGEHQHPFSKIKVQGIDIETAMQIAFRANMEYWGIGTIFLGAADGMIKAVNKYFYQDPNILYQVNNAWAAVGVGALPQITVTSADSGKGTVSSSVKTVTINSAPKQYEPAWGQSVTVVATPQPGYVFVNWTENGSLVTVQNGSSAQPAPQSYTFPAIGDRTLTANFAPIGVIDFGNVNVGQSSLPQTINISNYVQPIIYFTQPQLTGLGAADYSITSNTCPSDGLMMNQSCSIQVTFTPHSVGMREATLAISATAGGQTVLSENYPVSGSGVITGISVTSSSTPGGTVSLSGSQLWGGTATATATPNAGYAFTGWLEDGYIVSSAASYSFTVTASRDLLAMFSSTPAAIAATPSSGYFGAITTGTASPERTFTIINSGLQPLTISAISLSGINRAEFGVTYNDCVQDLSPGASCSIRINFTPVSPATKTARLNIASNAPATPTYVIDLSGYGGTPVMLYTGGFSSNYYSSAQNAYNSSYDGTEIRLWAADFNESLNCNRPVTAVIRGGFNGNFADQVGKSALLGTLTISSGTVVIDGLQIGGTSYQSVLSTIVNSPGSGTVTSSSAAINCPGNCTATLVNGDQVTLTAAPVGDATFTGWSGGGCSGTGNCTVTMTGDITVAALFSAAKISVAPSSESLGTVFAGTASPPQTITVTSSGTQALIIGTLALSGTNPTDFTLTDDLCSGQTLAPLAICTVLVSFNPASTGAKTASLTIPSNDPQTAVFSVSLNGIGALPTVLVTKVGDGVGTVTSSPAGISCGSSCTAAFTTNTEVTLAATPDPGYDFNGWSGACSGTGSCALTMNADYSVTATFIETPIASCSANPAKVNESYYPSIQAAYNAAPDNSTIKLLATDIYESFVADRAITVTLDGGYKCSFTSTQTETIIHGSPHLVDGIVNMMNIRVSQ